jgi:hypothetical protein
MTLRAALSVLVMLAPLWLGGCTDTVSSDRSFKPFAALMRSDDQTLTKAEQAAAIKELQADKTRQQQEAQAGTGAAAKTAQ